MLRAPASPIHGGVSEEAERKALRAIVIASALLHVVTAWLSLGYHQLDEHFQILEMLSYHLGHTPRDGLPVDFGQQVRPFFSIAPMYATQHGVFAWRPDGTLIGCGQHGFNVPNAPRRATAWCRSRCSSGKHPIAMCWRFEPAVPPRRADDLGRRSRLASRSGAKTRY